MNTTTIRLFDANHDFASDFDEKIEEILKSVHGENYYDVDCDFSKKEQEDAKVDVIDEKIEEISDQNPDMNINIVAKSSKKVSFKDFVPILFFMLMFAIILVAGYFFLNNTDILKLIK